jgi:hypothetical protein
MATVFKKMCYSIKLENKNIKHFTKYCVTIHRNHTRILLIHSDKYNNESTVKLILVDPNNGKVQPV